MELRGEVVAEIHKRVDHLYQDQENNPRFFMHYGDLTIVQT